MAEVRLEPAGKILTVSEGAGLREILQAAGISLDFPCGGTGRCAQCRVRVSPPSSSGKGSLGQREIADGERLACGLVVEGDCTIFIPEERISHLGRVRESGDGDLRLPEETPRLTRVELRLREPALEDQTADWERLESALLAKGARAALPDASGLTDLAGMMRASDWSVEALFDGGDFVWLSPERGGAVYGFAADLGTTTVDMALVDLETGAVAGRGTLQNRQVSFGADVISRAQSFHDDPEPVRRAAVDSLEETARTILDRAGVRPSQVIRTAVVGNPIMLHILNGIDPIQLTVSPFAPVVSCALGRRPRDLGFGFQRHGYVTSLPLVSAYVGADTVGMIVSLGLDTVTGTVLAADIGTNGEIVLACRGDLTATSTAAGPAFEGAQIRCGMRALPGAVYGVYIAEDGDLLARTIGGEIPKGICGTGLVSGIAQMLERGVLHSTGRLAEPDEIQPPALRSRIFNIKGEKAFALSEDGVVYISQSDVRKLQLAKGAVRTGMDTLLENAGVSVHELDALYLAGNFGAGLDCAAAMRIGLIPAVSPGKVHSAGNSALRGAVLALLSNANMGRAAAASRRTAFVELGGTGTFQNRFADAMMF
jgi:uncharacterized 2Fe-2S/4Fe-4S cluster protein (DUF4445 family)